MSAELIVLAVAVLIVIFAISTHGLISTVFVFSLAAGIGHFGFDVSVAGSVVCGIVGLAMSLYSGSGTGYKSSTYIPTLGSSRSDHQPYVRMKTQTWSEYARSRGITDEQ